MSATIWNLECDLLQSRINDHGDVENEEQLLKHKIKGDYLKMIFILQSCLTIKVVNKAFKTRLLVSGLSGLFLMFLKNFEQEGNS